MSRFFILSGVVLSGLGVLIGAFGAHKLNGYLKGINRLDTFETAVKYQFYHALGLILIGILMHLFQQNMIKTSGLFMLIGIIVFSGSLYTLCATNIGKWGAVTPIGGVLLLVAWALLFMGVWQAK
ncbi:MAG: DUF423 domain-containing protein [Cyclobacteriaceae bacterium]